MAAGEESLGPGFKWDPKSPLFVSTIAHILIALAILIPRFVHLPERELVDFEIYEPKENQPFLPAAPNAIAAKPKPKAEVPKRAVFGAARSTATSEAGEEVKVGNTVAKTPDQEKLNADDADALPVPVDEYLVNEMPALIEEIRVAYPQAAKERGIEGPVTLDLLIDVEGVVRQVAVVEGPGFGLNEAAMQAARRFKFRPARVEQKPVAIRIRYVYRFILER